MYRDDLTAAHEIIKSQQQQINSLKKGSDAELLTSYFSSLVRFKRKTIMVLLVMASIFQMFAAYNFVEAAKAFLPKPQVTYIIAGPIEIVPTWENDVLQMQEEVIYVKEAGLLRDWGTERYPAIWSAD